MTVHQSSHPLILHKITQMRKVRRPLERPGSRVPRRLPTHLSRGLTSRAASPGWRHIVL